jgi:predicted transcriptional regulator
VADKSLAKALKRKMGLDEGILTKVEVKRGESSLLMNPSRRRIFEFICNYPCVHLRAISRAVGFSTQTVKWHLNKLIEGGFISESSDRRKKIYLPLKNLIEPDECHLFCLLNEDIPRRIYLAIDKQPMKTQMELCKSQGLYQQILSRNLLSLENAGIITYEKIGRKKAYITTGRIGELEEAYDVRSKAFEKNLIDALEADSLNPTIEISEENILGIRLDIGKDEGPILRIPKNPLKALLGRS